MVNSPGRSFSALTLWCGLTVLGGLVSAGAGAPLGFVGLLTAVLVVPGAVSLVARTPASTAQRLSAQHEGAIWTVSVAAVASSTGGIVSPLVGLLLLVPLVALLEGDRRRAGDGAILALIGYGGLIGADRFIGLPSLPPWAWPLAAFPIVAALIWLAYIAYGGEGFGQKLAPFATSNSRAPRFLTGLDPRGAVCAVELTAAGRVRSVGGNKRLLPHLQIGQLAEQMVKANARDAFLDFLKQGGTARMRAPSGAPIRLFVRPHGGGSSLVAVPAEAEVAAIANAQSEGEGKVRAQNMFFASLSHDLKTPLNAILGFSDMMRAELKGPLPETYQDYAAIIHESGEDLMLLVEDILDLAKANADRQTLDIEPVDLAASGRSVLRQLQGQAERRGISLELDAVGDCWAQADARAVRQIWQNLVSNALKYSSEGQTVRLFVGAAGDHVELSVEDEGEGMDMADLDAIAAPFAQGRNAIGRSGTGLGLTVVKRFADLMGATAVLESAKGKGTKARILFQPADPADYAPLEDAAE